MKPCGAAGNYKTVKYISGQFTHKKEEEPDETSSARMYVVIYNVELLYYHSIYIIIINNHDNYIKTKYTNELYTMFYFEYTYAHWCVLGTGQMHSELVLLGWFKKPYSWLPNDKSIWEEPLSWTNVLTNLTLQMTHMLPQQQEVTLRPHPPAWPAHHCLHPLFPFWKSSLYKICKSRCATKTWWGTFNGHDAPEASCHHSIVVQRCLAVKNIFPSMQASYSESRWWMW